VAKGYRFDKQTGTLKGTGIISIATIPSGAAIYLDGQLYSAGNNTINDLSPGKYHLKVSKDGFSNWDKDVAVVEQKVTLVNVTLFPSAPDLRPLTFSGVSSPQMSPDGQRIVYSVTDPAKAGLWVLDISNRPFTFSRDPKQIAKDGPNSLFSKATFSWAPDSKTVLVTITPPSGPTANYLLDVDRLNDNPNDISSSIDQTKAGWQQDLDLKTKDQLSRLPKDIVSQIQIASAKWSPDELKVAWKKDGAILTYDSKKNLTSKITGAKDFSWYPDSDHLILVEEGSISIVEVDASNKTTIYGGTFTDGLVFSWPDGSKLVIVASFNKTTGANLYSISLR